MCYFPVIVVSRRQVPELNRRLAVYHLKPLADLGWLNKIAPKRLAFWLTNGHCGCGLYRRANQHEQASEVRLWLGTEGVGLSRALLDELKGIGRFGLWIQWGNRLPPLLRPRQVEAVEFSELRESASFVVENVFYDVKG